MPLLAPQIVDRRLWNNPAKNEISPSVSVPERIPKSSLATSFAITIEQYL